MVPIWEQGSGHGIGYSLESFLDRFLEICAAHQSADQAKAFAFILYNFRDRAIRAVLSDHSGFVELDRLAGRHLSVFYLDDASKGYVDEFNSEFLKLLQVDTEARTPCVVFFRVNKGKITEASVANLDNENLVTSFHELYMVLQAFRDRAEQPQTRALRLFTSAAKFIATESLAGLIGAGVGRVL